MTFETIIADLKQRKFRPIYFLMGDEPYYIDKISDYVAANVLKEEEKAFNQTVLYGKDVDAAAVTNAAKRYPMMAPNQVILVKEAQHIRNVEDLVYYAGTPLKSTILVICYKYKKIDKRKKLYKALEKEGVIFESKKMYDDKLPAWIVQHLKEEGYSIAPPAAMLLSESLGNDLSKIENELQKLIITLPQGKKAIDAAHIEQNIGISKDFNSVELQKALVERNALKAFRIVDYFGHNQKNHPINMIIASMYGFFNKVFMYGMLEDKSSQNVAEKLKVHPFFVSEYQKAARVFPPAKSFQILGWLREYDLRTKGVGNLSATPHDLLKEMIYKFMTV